MNGRRSFLLAALVLLAFGCQQPAPVAVAPLPLPPSVTVVQPPQPLGTPFVQSAAPAPAQVLPGNASATVSFLRALAQTIEQKRSIDAEADNVYFQLLLDLRRKDLANFIGPPPGRGTSVSAGQVMAQTAIEQERRTGVLFTLLLQTPAPPDCRNLLVLYRDLLRAQAKRSRQQALYLRSMERDQQSLTESRTEQHNQDTERFRDEQEQRRADVNAEIERVRNSAPDIAAQVLAFRVRN